MVEAHCADALVCISNCDKITPGMLMAAMRLNLPAVFVSGGPMEAGKTTIAGKERVVDIIDALVASSDPNIGAEEMQAMEEVACPTCGSCSGMFTANSMNCLTEALGLALPGKGSIVATHGGRKELFLEAGRRIVEMTRAYYELDDERVLPRNIANFAAFENAMCLDIAMGGSTNTVLHLLAAAYEGEIDFTMADIDRLSRKVPNLCKVSPAVPHYHMEDVHRAGGVLSILGELEKGGLLNTDVNDISGDTLDDKLAMWDVGRSDNARVVDFYKAAPGNRYSITAFSQNDRYEELDLDRAEGCIRDIEHAYSTEGGLIALVEDGDEIEIDIPKRILALNVDPQEIERRHQAMQAREDGGWRPGNRDRKVSRALRAYARFARSAAYGAVRDPDQ